MHKISLKILPLLALSFSLCAAAPAQQTPEEKMESYDWKAGLKTVEYFREQRQKRQRYIASFGTIADYAKDQASRTADGKCSIDNEKEITDPDEKQKTLKKLKAECDYEKLPETWKRLIEENFENIYVKFETQSTTYDTEGKVTKVQKYDKPRYYAALFFSSSLDIRINSIGNSHCMNADILRLDAVTEWLNELPKTPAINPKTKKSYITITAKDTEALSSEEKKYAKALYEVVNENIHFLGNSPFPKIDMKEVQSGAYYGKGFFVPVLTWLLDKQTYPTEIAQLKKHLFGKDALTEEEEEKFEIQKRLGIPVHEPHLAFPPEKIGIGYDRYCDCIGMHYLCLGGSGFEGRHRYQIIAIGAIFFSTRQPVWTVARLLHNNLEDTRKSIKKLRERLDEEVERTEAGTPLRRFVKKIADDAQPYLNEMDEFCENYMKLCGFGKDRNIGFAVNNIPHTLLDPQIKSFKSASAKNSKKNAKIKVIRATDKNKTKKSAEEKKKERDAEKKKRETERNRRRSKS